MSLLPLDGPAAYKSLSVGAVTPVEVKVEATVKPERKVVTIQPIDGIIYYGYDTNLTKNNGTKIFKGQWIQLEVGDMLPIFIIADSGTVDVRISEVA